MLAPRVDNRPYFAPLLVGLIVLAWVVLIAWGESPYDRFLSHHSLGEVRGNGLLMLAFVAGWTVMIIAMMLPTTLPLVNLFQRITARREDRGLLLVLLLAGYLACWVMFGVGLYAGDWVLHQAIERSAWLHHHTQWLGASALLVAGVYQFTPLKYKCLDKCRSPYSFIVGHWTGSRERLRSFALGVHHGIFCVGCCWSLMLLMFAVGSGNIGWMLVVGTVMAVEKNMPWGRQLSAPLGLVLIFAAGASLLLAGGSGVCAHDGTC